MKKRLFFVTEFFHESQNTTGYILGRLYQSLLKQEDLEVILIAKDDPNIAPYKDAYYVKGIKLNKKNLKERLTYELKISYDFFQLLKSKLQKDDVVFCGTTPILLLPVIYTLKKLKGFEWILVVHDVFPENLVSAGIFNKNDLSFKAVKKVFDKIYSKADKIIVIGRDMQELVYKKTKSENIFLIQNWVNEDDILVQSKSENMILKSLRWENSEQPIFQFFGNIGRVQGLDKIIDAISLMKNLDQAKFLFIGDGAYVDELKRKIDALNHPNVVYYGRLEPDKKSIGLNACDISLITLADGMLGLGVPSKSYYSMAADKKLFGILDDKSEISYMINEHNLGWQVSPKDVTKIAEKLDEIVDNFQDKISEVSSRKVLQSEFSENIAINKIYEVIRNS